MALKGRQPSKDEGQRHELCLPSGRAATHANDPAMFAFSWLPNARSLPSSPTESSAGWWARSSGRFERKGFRPLYGLKQIAPSRELAEQHYGVHKERPFFAGLVDFIASGPVVAMVWEGDGVIASARG